MALVDQVVTVVALAGNQTGAEVMTEVSAGMELVRVQEVV